MYVCMCVFLTTIDVNDDPPPPYEALDSLQPTNNISATHLVAVNSYWSNLYKLIKKNRFKASEYCYQTYKFGLNKYIGVKE